ncbi:hypothetical protein BDV28DRAFT_133482 [Aspergillus coremiiformis]|uniref:Uncharacterized protein n=1 Tax=Aspergillus coremiiformis TaxID=138285 RepID=A0A5N6Z7S8_9EURO|nr:hypothetical protein BDV28DRAFT_133482 [Aspergillus coremiiformis]
MKVSTIVSVLCLAATQLVAADTVTSTATNTITKTVYRVNETLSVTPLGSSATATSSAASTNAQHTSAAESAKSTSSTSSASTAHPSTASVSSAGTFDINIPVALAAGSFTLLFAYL